MRSKKALALLVAASMVFTMNTAAFAGVEANEEVKVQEEVSQSSDSQTMNKQEVEDAINGATDGIAEIDKSETKEVEITQDLLKKLAEAKDVKKVEIETSEATLTIPKAVLNQLLDKLPANKKMELETELTSTVPEKSQEKSGLDNATQMFSATLKLDNKEFKDEFKEKVSITFDSTPSMGLKTADVICTSSDPVETIAEKIDVSGFIAEFAVPHFSDFVVGKDTEYGWISANFAGPMPMYVEKDGILHRVTDIAGGEIVWLDDQAEYDSDYKVVKTANKANDFKITTPMVSLKGVDMVYTGYHIDENGNKVSDKEVTKLGNVKPVRWAVTEVSPNNIDIVSDNGIISAEVGGTLDFKAFYEGEDAFTDGNGNPWFPNWGSPNPNVAHEYYALIVEPVDTVKTTSLSANGHTIEIEYNKTPAYTGKKIKAGDFIKSIKLDGTEIDSSLAKFKTKGKKAVNSTVTVELKSIKGLDKDSNKQLKGQKLEDLKIRPIQATEVGLWDKKFGAEGKIIVSLKNGTPKKVYAVVAKNYKFNKGNGGADHKGKKVKIKKNTYSYDSTTKRITFNGEVVGTVKVGVASK